MGLFDDMTATFNDSYWGLDFGTFRSVIGYISGADAPKVPAYKDACLGGIPSLFWRDENGREYVGDEVQAKDGLLIDPAGVCSSVKTKLETPEVRLHGKTYSTSEIAVRIIQRVLQVSEQLLEQEFVEMDIQNLVVGVPVRFNASQRGEIARIVEIATGGKKVRLVPEPILAALCVDYFLRRTGGNTNRPVLVFDMGAGTFDAVVLRPNLKRTMANPYPYEAINPQGMDVAGDRMDTIMEDLILEKLRKDSGSIKMSVLENQNHQDRIRLRTVSARTAKERLSETDEINIQITGVECGVGMVHITRSEYEQRIRPDVQKTMDLAAEVVKKAGLWGNKDLDIILVGGSTYIPLIKAMLLEKFNWLEESDIQQRFPEKAVALGAAIYAKEPEIVLPRVAYGYAVGTYVHRAKKSMLDIRIPPNADLPLTVKDTYYTRFERQDNISFKIYEVDHGETGRLLEMDEGKLMTENGQIYRICHYFGRNVPQETQVELTTTLSQDGLLTLQVDDLGISPITVQTFNLTNNRQK